MAIRTEETFQLRAPADRVWAYLIDPRQVVTCLPGAELTSVQDDSTFLGKVKVKVGPVVAAYSGKVVITERDDTARIVRMVGDGRESAGSGSAKVSITSTVVELPDGLTEVRVTADLDIVGKIAQFGRGMIESVNKQMFRQFTECVRATLETRAAEAVTAATAATAATATATAAPSAAASPTTPSAATPGGGTSEVRSASPPDGRDSSRAASAGEPQFAVAKPVRLLPLLAGVVWERLTALVRRLLGRRTTLPR